jgi:hypothetical protein
MHLLREFYSRTFAGEYIQRVSSSVKYDLEGLLIHVNDKEVGSKCKLIDLNVSKHAVD